MTGREPDWEFLIWSPPPGLLPEDAKAVTEQVKHGIEALGWECFGESKSYLAEGAVSTADIERLPASALIFHKKAG